MYISGFIAKPSPVILLTGRIIASDDIDKNYLKKLTIYVTDENNRTVSKSQPEPNTHTYHSVLPMDIHFKISVVDSLNKIIKVLSITPSVSDSSFELEKDIILIEKQDNTQQTGKTFTFKEVYFDFGKAIIKEEAYAELNLWVQTIKENQFNITIEGHTDNVGKTSDNLQLSERRSIAIKKYMIAKGCDETSINTIGYGETRPIANNQTEEGRAINRRIEIRINNK